MKNKWLKDSRLGRFMRRLLGEEKGAVAMEYIVIALLVGAAVVALVMVFSGSLRNMLSSTNKTINSKNTTDITTAAGDLNTGRGNQNTENTTANEAGDQIGGEFGNK